MFFYAITSAGPRGLCRNTESEKARVLKTQRGLADVSVSEKHV